jgi:hypothetical protein
MCYILPLGQTTDFYGQLFKGIRRSSSRYIHFLVFVSLDKDVTINTLVFLWDYASLQRVEHVRLMGTLEGARTGSGVRSLGRGLKASK